MRDKRIDAAIAGVNKMYGHGAILAMGDDPKLEIPVQPTGLRELDNALGIGGLPKGRIIEIFGREGVGKSTMLLKLLGEAQGSEPSRAVLYVDAEHALDLRYATECGVNVYNMLVSQPDCGEQALEIVDHCIRSGAFGLIGIDSVAALAPRVEIEGDMGDNAAGLRARLMSQALRKLTAAAARNETTVVFVNQLRPKVGVTFGNPETTTGGQALKFYSSMRIELRKTVAIVRGDKAVGHRVDAKVVKNKFAPPYRTAALTLIYDHGFLELCECVVPEMSTSNGWAVASCLVCGGVAR